jgi:hypothetical protein
MFTEDHIKKFCPAQRRVLGNCPGVSGGTSEPLAGRYLFSSILAIHFNNQMSTRTRTKDEDDLESGGGANKLAHPGLIPGWNGAKLRAVLDGMDLSQSLQTILYVFSPVHTARSGQESFALLAASGQGFTKI